MKKFIGILALVLSVFNGVLIAEANEIKREICENLNKFKWKPLFPDALFSNSSKEKKIPFVKFEKKSKIGNNFDESELQSVLLNNDIFAIYGKPNAYTMGLLGQYSLEKIEPVMNEFVKMYDDANAERGIIPAFYIIYGTCWPEGDIGILPKKTVEKYIEFAAERGWLVYLDHQIGKYSVKQAMEKLLPFLKYPNVHLALDPEWKTTKPMKVIGSVTAEELNLAQKMMNNYIIDHGIEGNKMLVIHQFNSVMIKNRKNVNSNFERVQLIHCADGFGHPRLKKESYAYNALATNMPLKSFKLFLKPKVQGAGYDWPLMSPKEVLQLKPRPCLIMYQ